MARAERSAASRLARLRIARGLAILVLLAFPLTGARAGEVRVDVAPSGTIFTPYVVNLNQGDHVVWVWKGSGHTVTNWNLPVDSTTVSYDGTVFDSDPGGLHFGQNNSTRFSWKSDRTGTVTYVCVPHAPDMSGRVIISPLTTPPTIPVADFRLTEVQFNVAGGQDLIEISNLGAAAGNLGHYRIALIGTGTGIDITGTLASGNDFVVPAGGRVILHLNVSGTNTAPSDLFLPGQTLADAAGSVALYVPSALSFQNALTNKDLLIDFVQWGAPGQANETTAAQAGFWGAGTSINGVAAGHSIEYCAGATLAHGSSSWAEIAIPNFGSNGNCTTPVAGETWGQLKIIYRR